MSYELLESQTVFQGKVFKVKVDHIRSSEGQEHRVDVVEHAGSVGIVAVDEKRQVWLVRQYRHPAQSSLLEIPAGTLEPGENPENCARRECQEEIGVRPQNLTSLGGFYLAPGYSTEFMHVFLAQDLVPARLPGDRDEAIEIVTTPLPEFREQLPHLIGGDVKTVASLALAAEHLYP